VDFAFSSDQELLRRSLRELLDAECPPDRLLAWEQSKTYPAQLYARLAELGYYSLPLPTEYGGAGLGPFDLAIVGEELGRKSFDLAAGFGLTLFLAQNLVHHGSEAQKRDLLPKVIAGQLRFSVAITEPGAGSDAAALQTRAVPTPDGYLLTGQKVFSTGAGLPNTLVHLYARSNPALTGSRGISLFLVDPSGPGVSLRRLPMLGREMLGTYEITLDQAFVPADCLVGELDGGWRVLRSGLEFERLFISAGYVGLAQTILDRVVAYANTRHQFGRPIGSNQAIAHVLADLQTRVEAARLLVYRAAWLVDQSSSAIREVSMAKLFGSEALVEVARWGLQVFGGYGYSTENIIQLYLREALSTTITGGTSQIQRNIIAQKMGLASS
jgi:alkylation response protein AidB-like acyl-CoA dehydrogenase